MRWWSLAPSLAFAAAAAGAAAPPAEPTMMIVEFAQGAPVIGSPRRCPGATDDVPREGDICLAELYQGPVRLVRHLSDPRLAQPGPVRLTAHARAWGPGTRMLVLTQPFQDGETSGQFAYWWQLPTDARDFCIPTQSLAQLGSDRIARAFAAGALRTFQPRGFTEPYEFRCIGG